MIANRITEKIINKCDFWFDWFSDRIPLWEEHLSHLKDLPELKFIEIGCFDGRASIWLLNNILSHDTSSLTCIDPFDAVFEFEGRLVDMAETEERFDKNISCLGLEDKLVKMKATSSEALAALPAESYDVVYIDGNHNAANVLEDAVLSFRLLKWGGMMIFDDYKFTPYFEGDNLNTPAPGIDAFLNTYQDRYELLHRDYQVIIRKDIERSNRFF